MCIVKSIFMIKFTYFMIIFMIIIKDVHKCHAIYARRQDGNTEGGKIILQRMLYNNIIF